MTWIRLDLHSSIFWLSLTTVVLLAGLFATKSDPNFLLTSLPSVANTPELTHSPPTTFLPDVPRPDVTAVVLNWSRFPNVVRIVSLLCGSRLEITIAEIVVWNNSPRKLEQRDFSSTGCPANKLKIYNSLENLYFQARFIACAKASTPYCFIQDDDYLVHPEIMQTLRARIIDPGRDSSTGIHLLPPHEHLSSTLRTLSTPSHIHTSFAWLGHGALIPRSQVLAFLVLMGPLYLNVSEEEMKMADNFYTVLSNRVHEVWFDQGLELGGGEAFTVGEQGAERNRKYIRKAGEYLDSLLSNITVDAETVPFVNTEHHMPLQDSIARAPCFESACLLETTIELLPPNMVHSAESATDILALEEYNVNLLGAARQSHYLNYPPSNAVDGHVDTAFCSPESGRNGDSISLDMLPDVPAEWSNTEFVWLVDSATESILRAAIFEYSQDGIHWVNFGNTVSCSETNVSAVVSNELGALPTFLHECSVAWLADGPDTGSNSSPRRFRARLEEARAERWCIYEVWTRGKNRSTGMPEPGADFAF